MKSHQELAQETREHVNNLPQAEKIKSAFRERNENPIAVLIGMSAVNGIANLSGFTRYMERVLQEDNNG